MKKYLHTVTVTLSQTFTVLAPDERSARSIAMDCADTSLIADQGDITARVDGLSWIQSQRPRIGFYWADGQYYCLACNSALEYGTGHEYTCRCEEDDE